MAAPDERGVRRRATRATSPASRSRSRSRKPATRTTTKKSATTKNAKAATWLGIVRLKLFARDRASRRERARSFWRAVLVALIACAATYLRDVYVPASVRTRVVHSLPDWVNETVLARVPALALDDWRAVPEPGVGAKAQEEGLRPKHPVVIVPGFVSTGLELWAGRECGRAFFRRRMWGTPAMARAFFSNQKCWMEHMRLDANTGLDPEDIRLRAVRGLEGVDWFVPGYFVWAKIIHALGEFGYDANTIHSAAYDWRLSPTQLEKRDGYFTRLKAVIETLHAVNGERVAVLAHSYGDTISRYFFEWVELPVSKGGGGGGRKWVHTHVDSYVDIAGPMLGIPKTIPSLLSGEMRDTAILGELEGMLGGILETAVGRLIGSQMKEVCETFRTWGALWAMLPKGGNAVWGDEIDGAPEDELSQDGDAPINFLLQMRRAGEARDKGVNHTVESALDLLFEHVARTVPHNVAEFSHYASLETRRRLREKSPDQSEPSAPDFGNALESPLPHAPDMKIYCMYGVGKPAERAYVYEHDPDDSLRPYTLDVSSSSDADALHHGVRQVDGDGSIPLTSLGYACHNWRTDTSLNPANASVVIREYPHVALPLSVAGLQGKSEGDHVNIMGNERMIADIVAIVAGAHDSVHHRVSSALDVLARAIDRRRRRRHEPKS
jgi:phospholipid:diacylglycerol acyltransferase